MRISVVITTYNRAALLQSTLDALRVQDYGSADEVIVVDNGSSDNTRQVIAQAAKDFPAPFRVVWETVPGKTAALNAGFRSAAGDVFALTDDDVQVDERWLATIREIFSDPTIALVGGRVDPLWQQPPPWWLGVDGDERLYSDLSSPLALLHYGVAQELGARTAVGANMAVRRGVLDRLGGLTPDLGRRRGTLLCGEDHDLCQRATAAGLRCEYRPEMQVRHWVPAERARLRYFTRWFFWSGVTHAILEAYALADSGGRSAERHFLRQLILSSFRAAARLLTGRPRKAVKAAMDAAFAAGYLVQRIKYLTRGTPTLSRRDADAGTVRQQAGVQG
jgi:glycosyltransferase involved in cell wall biosynthesis